eukprot:COSAG04_NODE_14388_length_569_cov_0.804671_1_plen_98_part_10
MASSAPTALVVGMGTQMGYGLASTFAHAGYFVHLVSRTQSTLEAFASSLEEVEGSGGAGWTALDAHDVDGLQQAMAPRNRRGGGGKGGGGGGGGRQGG